MSKLYELTAEFLELQSMLEETEDEMDEEALKNCLEGIDFEIEVKADGYAKIMKNLESTVNALESEIERLKNRQNNFKNRIEYLKRNLEMCMRVTGKTKFKTDLFSFNIQKNGGKRKLVIDVDASVIPEEYHIKQPDKIDGDALRDYLKENGLEGADGSVHCDWCHLEPQSESLRIK